MFVLDIVFVVVGVDCAVMAADDGLAVAVGVGTIRGVAVAAGATVGAGWGSLVIQ